MGMLKNTLGGPKGVPTFPANFQYINKGWMKFIISDAQSIGKCIANLARNIVNTAKGEAVLAAQDPRLKNYTI
jgi:hypothetical protein